MFPETSFYRFGKQNLIFVIVNNLIYHTENSGTPHGDHISLCGLSFPLKKSETIQSMEKRYMKKNSSQLERFKEYYAETIKFEEEFLENLNKEITQNKNLHFFLSEVIPIYIGKEISSKELIEKKQEEGILEKILRGNVAIINKRIYPLYKIDDLSVIKVSGINYCFRTSNRTIESLEKQFMDNLEEQLKKEILEKIEHSKEIKEKVFGLATQIRDIALRKHVTGTNNLFEYGDVGYDAHLQKVYCILFPHYNKTIKKNLRERQGAIAVNILEQKLGTDYVILYRKKIDSNFVVGGSNLCPGMKPRGETTKDIVTFLLKAAENIRWNKAYHE